MQFLGTDFSWTISVTSTELRLHEASRNNDVETVRALVASNTDVNSKNNVRISDVTSTCTSIFYL